ncbi:MAG: hypothetical protein J0L72_01005 [Armatimonadetes bacterium]|nr:hypothetical protein [Armatimonadota bacterium]
MYLLTFSAEDRLIQAGLGGNVTAGECAVLRDEITSILETLGSNVEIELDATRMTKAGPGVHESLEQMRFAFASFQARTYVYHEEEVAEVMSPNVRAILENEHEEIYQIALTG